MGCAASKIDNEDVVRRCKERCRLMKDAVFARHHLAGAHSDYSRSLRLTGSALSAFASHEPLPVSLSTPAALLRRPSSSTPASAAPAPKYSTPPPPTPPPISPSPSSASAPSSFRAPPHAPIPSAASPSVKRLLHHNSGRSGGNARNNPAKFKVKLPHILSESSPNSSPPRGPARSAYPTAYIINNKGNGRGNRDDDYDYGSTYVSTPSQASSVWNWENFYPPSPPDSEYFDRRANEIKEEEEDERRRRRQQLSGYEVDEDGETTSVSEYDFFDNRKPQGSANSIGRAGSQKFSLHERGGIGLSDVEKGGKVNKRVEAEEVQCSEWGDHDYDSITSSSDDHEGDEEDNAMRSEIGTAEESARGRSESKGSRKEEEVEEKKSEARMRSSTMSYGRSDEGIAEEEMRMVVRHKDLKEIMKEVASLEGLRFRTAAIRDGIAKQRID